jgi:hypothetical protein
MPVDVNPYPWIRDVIGLAGCGLVVYGTWLYSRPAAFVVAGAMLVTMAILLSVSAVDVPEGE